MNRRNTEITDNEVELIDKYVRAANYLSACQLYLLDNPLLKRPLKIEDVKRKIQAITDTVDGFVMRNHDGSIIGVFPEQGGDVVDD